MKIIISIATTLMIVITATQAGAKDLGKLGQSFKITEEPFSAMMKKRLAAIDINVHQRELEEIARKRVENPAPVEGISKATKDHSFLVDPSYEVTEDIILPCGKLLYKKGTKVNPLDYMDLQRELIFIAENDKSQKEWLVEQIEERLEQTNPSSNELRIILVSGSVFKLKEYLEAELSAKYQNIAEQIYFDQVGEITTKFKIKAVPAIAYQEDKQIRIEEVRI